MERWIPVPHVLHPYPMQRFDATHPRREPYGAVKLVDDPAGESPASANYPVGTVVISGDGAGDQAVGSPDVNVLVGWVRTHRRVSALSGLPRSPICSICCGKTNVSNY